MKKVLFMLFVIVMFFNINIVKADDICSDEELARIKAIANNISYNYKFVGTDDNIAGIQTYSVSFSGITNDVYITDTSYQYKANSDSDIIYIDSGKRNFMVLSDNCFGKILRTIQLDLPKFNEYSTRIECIEDNSPKIDYCNPWYQGDITDNQFYKTIKEYNINIENSNKTTKDKIMEFIEKKYYIVLSTIIVLFIFIVAKILINHNKNILE